MMMFHSSPGFPLARERAEVDYDAALIGLARYALLRGRDLFDRRLFGFFALRLGLVEELGDQFVALLLFGLVFFDFVFLRLSLLGEVLIVHFPADDVLHPRGAWQTATRNADHS